MDTNQAVVTLWYINTDDPAAVLKTEPKADRGFGRKYLAQLNPLFPVTFIGQFPLNRSAETGVAEFYIGGYPGVTVVQTVIQEEALQLSQLTSILREAIPAQRLFIVAANEEVGYAGYARWEAGQLKRSFCATQYEILEDIGLPETFEGPFWAGEHATDLGGIALPFAPVALMREAQNQWLGIEVGDNGPDLHVVGYAVDGRPEPKVDEPDKPATELKPVDELSAASVTKLGLADYDDYEDHRPDPSIGEEFTRFAQASQDLAKHLMRSGGDWFKKTYRTFKDR